MDDNRQIAPIDYRLSYNNFFVNLLEYFRDNREDFEESSESIVINYFLKTRVEKSWSDFDIIFIMADFIDHISYKSSSTKIIEIKQFQIRSQSFLFDNKLSIIGKSLNDLNSINPYLAQITYLNIGFQFGIKEISSILKTSEETVRKEVELSKAFVLGWAIRDNKLESTLYPYLQEPNLIEFIENDVKEINSEAYKNMKSVVENLEYQIDGMKQINSRIVKMGEYIRTKTNNL